MLTADVSENGLHGGGLLSASCLHFSTHGCSTFAVAVPSAHQDPGPITPSGCHIAKLCPVGLPLRIAQARAVRDRP